MNEELKKAMVTLEQEKNISADTLFDAIESALIIACKSNFGRTENVKVEVDRETFEFRVWSEKTIVAAKEDVTDSQMEICAEDAAKLHLNGEVGDVVRVDFNSKDFGRIATQIAKNVILQKIREEERNAVYNYFSGKQRTVITGVVQRQMGKSWAVSLGAQESSFKAEGILNEKEQIPGERIRPNDRIRVYVLEVKKNTKGSTRILLSRTHPDLVRGLFEEEVTEIRKGIVEIRSIAREAGSRTKIAVYSAEPNVDPVGACVGLNGTRVNSIVGELNGEKIDIVCWDENPGNFIKNALSPAKISSVFAVPEENSAKVVVPDHQLSLAIGREGQNARLAARLTGFKIDIKDETHAAVTPGFRFEDYLVDEEEEEVEFEYTDENGNPVDENGNPLDVEYEYVDEEGNPVDENGNPLEVEYEYVDENGNPVDENGNPLTEDEVSEEDADGAQEDAAL